MVNFVRNFPGSQYIMVALVRIAPAFAMDGKHDIAVVFAALKMKIQIAKTVTRGIFKEAV